MRCGWWAYDLVAQVAPWGASFIEPRGVLGSSDLAEPDLFDPALFSRIDPELLDLTLPSPRSFPLLEDVFLRSILPRAAACHGRTGSRADA